MNKNTPQMPPAAPVVAAVAGGYRVSLGSQTHFVDKSRRCSCGRPNCPAISAVVVYLRRGGCRAPVQMRARSADFVCPLCGAPAGGSLENRNWVCSADPRHFWAWWAQRIRRAREQAIAQASPYTRQVLAAFRSDPERAAFLAQHALTYPAQT